jgi:uncharacterized protein YggE
MKKLLAGVILATSLAACSDRTPQVIAVPQVADVAKPGVMTINGSAMLEVSPDCADLTMTLTADGGKAGIAAGALAKKQQQIIDAMKALGIEGSQLKISYVSFETIYKDWQQTRIITYRASMTITATTKKFDQIAAMMEAGANAGATSMSSQFRRSDLPELKKKVREMALRAAREKAELTAKTLGVSLGRVMSVAETPAGQMWHSTYFPNFVANEAAQAPALAAVALGGALQPLSLDVQIGFELGKSV